MYKAIDDCLATRNEELIEPCPCLSPDDRHVLAAAIRCGVQVVITENGRDFSKNLMGQYGMETQEVDEFLCDQIVLFGSRAPQTVTYATAGLLRR